MAGNLKPLLKSNPIKKVLRYIIQEINVLDHPTIVCKTVEPLLKFELFAKTRASHSFFMANLLKLVPQAPQTEQKKFFWTAPIAMKTKTRGEVIMIRFQAFQAERVLC